MRGNDEAVGVLEGDGHVKVVLGVETGQPHHGGEAVDRLGVEVGHGVGGAEGLYDADKLEAGEPWLVVGPLVVYDETYFGKVKDDVNCAVGEVPDNDVGGVEAVNNRVEFKDVGGGGRVEVEADQHAEVFPGD